MVDIDSSTRLHGKIELQCWVINVCDGIVILWSLLNIKMLLLKQLAQRSVKSVLWFMLCLYKIIFKKIKLHICNH